MKGLKKLALATAVAAAPFAQAELTAMDDALLGEFTGQAGLTLDINLDMEIDEIRYADEDGYGIESATDAGYLTFSNLVINGDRGTASDQALIRGVTIDVDGTDGIVIGFGEIGGQSRVLTGHDTVDLSGTFGPGASAVSGAAAAVLTSDYWTGVNVTADFGINGTDAGSFVIKDLTNFVPNALAMEGVLKFGYELADSTGTTVVTAEGGPKVQLTDIGVGDANLTAITQGLIDVNGDGTKDGGQVMVDAVTAAGGGLPTQAQYDAAKGAYVFDTGATNDLAEALTAGTYVDAYVAISAGGAVDSDAGGAEGLTINASVGFVIQEMAYVDDGNKFGVHNFTMFDTTADGEITGFQVTGLKIDVVDHTSAVTGQANEALLLSGMTTSGTIAMGDIFVGDHDTGSLGAVAIRGIDMSNTQIYIYGH